MSSKQDAAAIGLMLDPLDTLFFRDGRPFGAGTRASGGLPNPQTLAGALRTALLAHNGFDFAKFASLCRSAGSGARKCRNEHASQGSALENALREAGAPSWVVRARFRGPWLALFDSDDAAQPLLPTPWTLFRDGDRAAGERWSRADPLEKCELPGWSPPADAMLPLWHSGSPDAKRPGGFLTPDGIKRFLAGGEPADEHWLREDELFGFDPRTGIAVDADTFTAAEHMLYTISLLALKPKIDSQRAEFADRRIGFYCELIVSAESEPNAQAALPDLVPFGGEGRYVRSTKIKTYDWKTLSAETNRESSRAMWLLATPGLFQDGDGKSTWRPNVGSAQLVAAASPNPIAVSGWDVARCGPKPTRFGVPAGSVYYTEGIESFPHESMCHDPEDVAQGWGFALKGVWK